MKYSIRKGIVTETVCGRILLIATFEAREHCPYLVELNEASSYIWQRLAAGETTEAIARAVEKDFAIPFETAKNTVDSFVTQLVQQEYLILESEEENHGTEQ